MTEEDIAAVEALITSRKVFTYGQMFETEAYLTPDGTSAGFAAKMCGLLTDLFGVEFALELYEWDDLMSGLGSRQIDFTGDLTPTAERMEFYFMTHPIAERTLRIVNMKDAEEIQTPKDIAGWNIGTLAGSIDAESVQKYYPEIPFHVVDNVSIDLAASLLVSGEIDAFICEGVIDPLVDGFGVLRSKEFFPLVYTPVSLTTANPELAPIITIMNKYYGRRHRHTVRALSAGRYGIRAVQAGQNPFRSREGAP